MKSQADISIVVVGASGDLAQRKILPALFSLFCQARLPDRFHIFGFARSRLTDAEFRANLAENLTCRYTPKESCDAKMEEFLTRCRYVSGHYDSRDSMLDLYALMKDVERPPANRLYYLAIPPSVFLDVAHALAGSGLVDCGNADPWSRVVVEKPFGSDRTSSDALTRELAGVFNEDQTYRIDHYLGKEVVQNLLVLRFANLVFEPVWNRDYVRSVEISWKEDFSIQGRGGYFDTYGIIRDVVQNHLLQILSLVAMEPPRALDSHAIRDAKVAVLRCIPPVGLDHLVVGQYTRAERAGQSVAGYADEAGVSPSSITPTFAAALLEIRNERWQGTPFLLRAGKGLDRKLAEIRIRFREVRKNLFCKLGECPDANELVIRIQPDEAIEFRIVSKVPGLGMALDSRNLDLRYKAAFDQEIPEAYESLLLDVLRGDKSLFIRNDELAAAWDIVTPALRELEEQRIRPQPYAFGSAGPAAAEALAVRAGLYGPRT